MLIPYWTFWVRVHLGAHNLFFLFGKKTTSFLQESPFGLTVVNIYIYIVFLRIFENTNYAGNADTFQTAVVFWLELSSRPDW